MIILGIDPGTAEMGWGIIQKQTANSKQQTAVSRKPLAVSCTLVRYVGHGVIKTSSKEPLSKRLVLIKRGVEELVERYAVEEIVIERVVFNVNKKSAISVAQSYGVILLLAGERDIPVHEYNALEAKLLIAGHGRADKKVVQQAIKKKLRLKEHPTPVHAADALAIALCHISKADARFDAVKPSISKADARFDAVKPSISKADARFPPKAGASIEKSSAKRS